METARESVRPPTGHRSGWLWKLFHWVLFYWTVEDSDGELGVASKVEDSDGEQGVVRVYDFQNQTMATAKESRGSVYRAGGKFWKKSLCRKTKSYVLPPTPHWSGWLWKLFNWTVAEDDVSDGEQGAVHDVIEDGNTSPVELAKAYMGRNPSKVSPSVLRMHNQVGREDTKMLSSLPSASSSPNMALTENAPPVPENCFITPRSRGRLAIYNIARTPCSKLHRTSNLKVIEDDNSSLAELAYMGSRPSKKVSPSVIGMRNQVDKKDTRLLSSLPSASSSPIVELIKKYPSAPDNCLITPRSRGRSTIYNMARTPYSKLHRTSNLKYDNASPAELAYVGSRTSKVSPSVIGMRNQADNKDTRLLSSLPSVSSSPIVALIKKYPTAPYNGLITPRSRGRLTIYNKARAPNSKFHRTSNLKVIDNGNAYPAELAKAYMRSRPSKVSPSVLGMHNRVGRENTRLLIFFPSATSSPKMPLPKMPQPHTHPDNGFITLKSRGRSTTYNMARILRIQLLIASNPKRAGINSNGSAGPSIPSSLSPIEKNENFGSPKSYVAPLDKNDSVVSLKASTSDSNEKFGSPKTYVALLEKNDYVVSLKASTSESNEKFVSPKTYVAPLDKNDSVVSFKASNSSVGAADIIEKAEAGASASQPPQSKGALRMSVQEDFFEQDDDVHCKISEVNSNAVTLGEVRKVVSSPISEETRSASQLPVFPSAFDKPKEANNPPVFSFSPASVGNIPSLPSESTKEAELKAENSSSVLNVSASSGSSQVGIPESDKSSSHLDNLFEAGDTSGKFASFPSVASNGQPPISSPPPPISSIEKFGSPKTYVTPLDNNDSVVSLEASTSSADATDFIDKDGASTSQPPQNKGAFRMSVQEDFFEQDDDADCNELATRPFSETKGTMEVSLKDSKVAPRLFSEMKRKYPEQIPVCTNRKRCRIC